MSDEITQKEQNNFLMVFGGHILFQTLYAAVELDLFNKLSERKELSLAQISELLGIQQQPARILLLGLASTGILKRNEEGLYANTPVAEAFLTSHSPKNVLNYVKLQHHVMYRGMFHFLDSLKAYKNIGLKEFPGDEPTLYQRLGHDPKLKQIFQDAMHELSVHANADLAKNLDLSDVKFLVDVGGGDGTNAIELVRKFPSLKAAVFDLPVVSPIANKKINESQLSDRIHVIPGNCFEDDLPTTADCFIFCHFCTIWSAEKNKILFNKAYKALPENGKIIIFNMMQDSNETGPLTAAIGSPYFLAIATGEGMLYTWKEYETWLSESGFVDIKMIRLERDHGAIIGVKAS
jgi:hypothetical protein